MLHNNYGCKSVLGYALLAATTAYADTSADQWLPDGHVSGDIRVYDFSRNYGNSKLELSDISWRFFYFFLRQILRHQHLFSVLRKPSVAMY